MVKQAGWYIFDNNGPRVGPYEAEFQAMFVKQTSEEYQNSEFYVDYHYDPYEDVPLEDIHYKAAEFWLRQEANALAWDRLSDEGQEMMASNFRPLVDFIGAFAIQQFVGGFQQFIAEGQQGATDE